MDQPESARDFYFRVVAPAEQGRSYQAHYQRDLPAMQQPEAVGLDQHSGKLSNDPLLEDLMERLIERSFERLRTRLSEVFVAKRRNWVPSASTINARPAHKGDFIEFHVGFSDMTLQVACLFEAAVVRDSTRQQVAEAGLRMGYVSESSRDLGESVIGDLGFKEEDDLTEFAVNLSTLGDMWGLAHGISHQLLGHSGGGDSASDLLDQLPSHLRPWEHLSRQHAEELQADALAFRLLVGDRPSDSNQEEWEAVVGAHLALTTLFFADPDPWIAGAEHPPVLSRLAYANQLSEVLAPDVKAKSIANDFRLVRDLVTYLQAFVDGF